MKVRVLADNVINCIAAGEVIERPASVVRELLDNALDAGAGDILVQLEEGGQRLVRVQDDGCGMERDDALLAFERHATSKVREVADLNALSTFGFRGEALSSIAAVSRVRLRTRAAGSPLATELMIEAGQLKDVHETSGPQGTEIDVRNIFFNTPARRKFLRQPKTEAQRVKALVVQRAIVHPEVRFRLFSDEREVLHLARRSSPFERAGELLRGTTVSFSEQFGEIKVAGVIAHPSMAQMESSALAIFVNRRLVNDRLLLRAVKEGFSSTLKEREYPLGYVSIEMPAELVDVNVHPQKSEVRFRESQQIFRAVRQAVLAGVQRFRAPVVSGGWEPRTASSPETGTQTAREAVAPYQGMAVEMVFNRGSSATPGSAPALDSFRFSDLKFIGQAFACYLFCEYRERLYVVDAHAAHERCNYNRIRAAAAARPLAVQQLLVPLTVELTEEGLQNCLEQRELLQKLGFEIEAFGSAALAVRAAPALLPAERVAEVIKEIAAVWLEPLAAGRFQERLDAVCARIACHASVRAGNELSREEVYALFEALDDAELSSACPHGRPIIVDFSKFDVERWFGRDR